MNEQIDVGDYVSKPQHWAGTVRKVIIDHGIRVLCIERDDGVQGGGSDGFWRVATTKLTLLSKDTATITISNLEEVKHKADPFIPGLDHEGCDWDAHKTFIKGLG